MRLSWPLSWPRASRSTPNANAIAATNAQSGAESARPSATTRPGERGGRHGVRVEREAAQHDPGSEQAGGHREQQDLDEAALDEGEVEGLEHAWVTGRGRV